LKLKLWIVILKEKTEYIFSIFKSYVASNVITLLKKGRKLLAHGYDV